MSLFRRLSQPNSQSNSQQQPPSSASVNRASTTSGTRGVGSNNPYRSPAVPDVSELSLNEPPPPSYDSALRHSIDGRTTSPQQVAQQASTVTAHHGQYQPPVTAPPPQVPAQQRPPRQQTTAQPGPSAAPQTQPVARSSSVEDPLAPLGKYDIVVLVDDSPSMLEGNKWDQTRAALMGVAEQAVRFDKDGIELVFMNSETRLRNVSEVSTVREAFDAGTPAGGSTPTAMMLDEIVREYVESVEDAKASKLKVKPLIVLVLTDGRPDDETGVVDCVVEMAGRLDEARAPPYQLGIQFVQVGDDQEAAMFLQQLDDDLKAQAGVRDIVDTTPFAGSITADFILKALLGSVNRRLDSLN